MAANAEFGATVELIVEASLKSGVAGVVEAHRGMAGRWTQAMNDMITEMATRASSAESQLMQASQMIGAMKGEMEAAVTTVKMKDNKFRKAIDSSSAKEAQDNLPPIWEGKNDKVPFKVICNQVKNWAHALHAHGVKLVERAERGKSFGIDYVQTMAGMADGDDAKEFLDDFDGRMFRMLTKHMRGDAESYVKNPMKSGLEAWKCLCGHFDPQDQAGKNAAYTRITNPGRRAKDTIEARKLVREWQVKVDDYEARYEKIMDQQKMSTLLGILPMNAVDNVFRARAWSTYELMTQEVTPWLEYRTVEEANKESKAMPEPVPMDIDSIMTWSLEGATDEQKTDLIAQLKGGKGKGGKGLPWKGGYNGYVQRDSRKDEKGKGEEKGKGGKDGKSKGKGKKGLFDGVCYTCGKYGHSARYCRSSKGLNSFEEDEGEKEEESQDKEEPDGEGQEDWGYLMAAMTDDRPQVISREWNKPSRKMTMRAKGADITKEWYTANVEDKLEAMSEKKKLTTRLAPARKALSEDVKLRGCGHEEGDWGCQISTLIDEKDAEGEHEVLFSFGDKGNEGEWVKIEAAVDSAAVDNVMRDETIPHIKKGESEGSKTHKKWWSASGHEIRNEGEKIIPFQTGCKKRRRLKFQIAKVGKTLISVDKLNETGHTVILNSTDPRIVCPNGEEIKLKRKNKVFILDLWVKCTSAFSRR